MSSMHFSRHTMDVAEKVTAGSFAMAVAAVALISAATLVYAWFIA